MLDLLIYDTIKQQREKLPVSSQHSKASGRLFPCGKISKLSYVEAEKIVSLKLSGHPCLLILDYAKTLMGQLSSEHCTH